MISNPNLVLYACVARGSLILAEFSSEEPGIETLAAKCIENTPPHHSMFSHTVRQRNYTFLIEDPFAYFGIFDETIDKAESLWLLNRLKFAADHLIKNRSIENPGHLCCQSKFDPVFAEIMGLDVDVDLDLDLEELPKSVEADSRNTSLDLSKGARASMAPLLVKHMNTWKKKKKRPCHLETNGDDAQKDRERKLGFRAEGNNGVFPKDLKNGIFLGVDHLHRQKAKQTWRKHVWVVLTFDLFICAVLFGIWLWVCQGFQCIDG